MEALNNLARLAPNILHVAGQVRQATSGAAMSSTVALKYLSGDVDTDQTQVTLPRVSIGNYKITVNNATVTGTTNAIAIACACTTGSGYLCWVNDVATSGNNINFVVQTSSVGHNDCSFNFMVTAYTPL